MIEKIRCVDATASQMADVTNGLLRRSKNLVAKAYSKDILNSSNPKFTKDSIQKFYNISDFYEKSGNVKEQAKPVFSKALEDLGLNPNCTLWEFSRYVLGLYK